MDYFFCVSRIIWDDKTKNNSFIDNQNEVIEEIASSLLGSRLSIYFLSVASSVIIDSDRRSKPIFKIRPK